jgi:RNA polymerase sigma-70 factor (ECF subfamily)
MAVLEQMEGRDAALARLVASSARKGFAVAHDLLGDRAEAEDAVQEALARACERWDRLRDPAALDGWFFRVLTNHCLRLLKRRRWRRWLASLGGVDEHEVADPAPRADEALAEGQGTARTLAIVAGLPPMQKAAIVLRYGHDLGVGEIAALLGVGTGTVKTHLVRGLDRLRRISGGRT